MEDKFGVKNCELLCFRMIAGFLCVAQIKHSNQKQLRGKAVALYFHHGGKSGRE